jgi:hypothetical protein
MREPAPSSSSSSSLEPSDRYIYDPADSRLSSTRKIRRASVHTLLPHKPPARKAVLQRPNSVDSSRKGKKLSTFTVRLCVSL